MGAQGIDVDMIHDFLNCKKALQQDKPRPKDRASRSPREPICRNKHGLVNQMEIKKQLLFNLLLNPIILLPKIIRYVQGTKVTNFWMMDIIQIIQPTHRIQKERMYCHLNAMTILLSLILLQALKVMGR